MQGATYFFICVDLSLALFEEPALFPLPFLVSVRNRVVNHTCSYISWALCLFLSPLNFSKCEIGFIFIGWGLGEFCLFSEPMLQS